MKAKALLRVCLIAAVVLATWVPRAYAPTGLPAIDLEKSTNGVDADVPPGPTIPVGDPVEWVYVVANIGDDSVDVTVTDDLLGVICTATLPGFGDTLTCTANGSAIAGQYANLGSAVATDPEGNAAVDSDPSHYFGVTTTTTTTSTTTTIPEPVGKVTICHWPPGNPANNRTLRVYAGDVSDHLAHGDFIGPCF